MFLGDQLLPLIVLAMGCAMAVGTALALVRPPGGTARRPANPQEGPAPSSESQQLVRPSLARSLAFIGIGLIAAVWALATLLTT